MKPTTPRPSSHWAQINEVSFVGGMRALFFLYRCCGRWPFRLALYPVLLWFVASNRRARTASAQYLQLAHQRNPQVPTGLTGVLRHFASFAESILDKMLLWGGQFKLDQVAIHGHPPLLEAIAQGRGGLLICTHLGNLELCRVMSGRCPGLKMTVLVHTKHAQAFNRMLAHLNPGSELNLLQVTEMSPATAIMLAEKVAQGEFVVIAGDRIPVSPQPRVAFADFLGQPAPFPVGPFILASLLQCPTFLLFSRRTANGADLHFEPFRDRIVLPRKERAHLLDQLAAAYAARLEHHCLLAPLQWFNFYDFWALPATDDPHAND